MDRFEEIENRLTELRNIVRPAEAEIEQLEKERLVLRAAAAGFRVGQSIRWKEKNTLMTGTIVVIWPNSYGGTFQFGVRVGEETKLYHVGSSKKPRPIRVTP